MTNMRFQTKMKTPVCLQSIKSACQSCKSLLDSICASIFEPSSCCRLNAAWFQLCFGNLSRGKPGRNVTFWNDVFTGGVALGPGYHTVTMIILSMLHGAVTGCIASTSF